MIFVKFCENFVIFVKFLFFCCTVEYFFKFRAEKHESEKMFHSTTQQMWHNEQNVLGTRGGKFQTQKRYEFNLIMIGTKIKIL